MRPFRRATCPTTGTPGRWLSRGCYSSSAIGATGWKCAYSSRRMSLGRSHRIAYLESAQESLTSGSCLSICLFTQVIYSQQASLGYV